MRYGQTFGRTDIQINTRTDIRQIEIIMLGFCKKSDDFRVSDLFFVKLCTQPYDLVTDSMNTRFLTPVRTFLYESSYALVYVEKKTSFVTRLALVANVFVGKTVCWDDRIIQCVMYCHVSFI